MQMDDSDYIPVGNYYNPDSQNINIPGYIPGYKGKESFNVCVSTGLRIFTKDLLVIA